MFVFFFVCVCVKARNIAPRVEVSNYQTLETDDKFFDSIILVVFVVKCYIVAPG